MIDEVAQTLADMTARIQEMRGYMGIDEREARLDALDVLSNDPGFWNDPNAARVVIGKSNQEKAVLNPFRSLVTAVEEAGVILELAEGGDETERNLMGAEATDLLSGAETAFKELELQSLLSSELDMSNAFLTVHAGAGGTESCDWADMLFRMYSRYCEVRGFTLSILEQQSGDEAGIKRVTALIEGPYAYGYLKAERGVHRLVRISPFDSNKRRHTSFAAVDVSAELPDDIEIEIPECDLRVDTYRASGAGGQHVNTTDSAVRMTHIPTGLVAACQAERSQHMNRAKALRVLLGKLYEMRLNEKRKEVESFYGPKGEIAWGSQIRSYVMQPYTMVKDHRTSVETSNINKVLDGAIQPFIEAYLKFRAGKG
jgi:peptide chain release factor 2